MGRPVGEAVVQEADESVEQVALGGGALEPAMSGEILELHHSKHHAAYGKGSNDALDRLAEAREKGDYETLVWLEKTFVFNLSGHVLRSIFWNNLSPDGGDRPDGDLAAAIDEHFGSFDAFGKQLSAATKSVQGARRMTCQERGPRSWCTTGSSQPTQDLIPVDPTPVPTAAESRATGRRCRRHPTPR
ncbi:superoxide dismutase [Plantactinospora sp. DSM 117369]